MPGPRFGYNPVSFTVNQTLGAAPGPGFEADNVTNPNLARYFKAGNLSKARIEVTPVSSIKAMFLVDCFSNLTEINNATPSLCFSPGLESPSGREGRRIEYVYFSSAQSGTIDVELDDYNGVAATLGAIYCFSEWSDFIGLDGEYDVEVLRPGVEVELANGGVSRARTGYDRMGARISMVTYDISNLGGLGTMLQSAIKPDVPLALSVTDEALPLRSTVWRPTFGEVNMRQSNFRQMDIRLDIREY